MVRQPRFLRARQLIVGNGSASAPPLRGPDADTGVYFTATQVLATISGTLQVRVDANGLTIVPSLGQLTLPDASAAAPSFRFSGATGTGMYRSGTADLGIAAGGAAVATFFADGRLAGLGLHNNGTVTGTTNQFLASGTWTPTLTNVANLDASTAYIGQWIRLGNVVTASGKVDVDPTLTATSTQLGISFPIASAITLAQQCCGTAFASGIASQGAAILGDTTNDRAHMQWVATDVTNQPMYFTFTYVIV